MTPPHLRPFLSWVLPETLIVTNAISRHAVGNWRISPKDVWRGQNNSSPASWGPTFYRLFYHSTPLVDGVTRCWTVTVLMMSKGPSLTGIAPSRARLSEDSAAPFEPGLIKCQDVCRSKGEGRQCMLEIAFEGQGRLAAQCINDEGKLIYIVIMKLWRSWIGEGDARWLSPRKWCLWEYFSNHPQRG